MRKVSVTPRITDEMRHARKPMPYDILQAENNSITQKVDNYAPNGRFSQEYLKNYEGPYERMMKKINGQEQRVNTNFMVECKKVPNPPMLGYKMEYTKDELLELPMMKKKSSIRPNSAHY